MIHNLPDHERAVIYTLGRLTDVKGPGMVFVIPGLQTMKRVDLRNSPSRRWRGRFPGDRRMP